MKKIITITAVVAIAFLAGFVLGGVREMKCNAKLAVLSAFNMKDRDDNADMHAALWAAKTIQRPIRSYYTEVLFHFDTHSDKEIMDMLVHKKPDPEPRAAPLPTDPQTSQSERGR